MNDKQPNSSIDYTLVFILLLLGIVSVFTLYTLEPVLPAKYDNSNFAFQQIIWYIVGGIVIVVTMLIDYDRFHQITWFLYGVGILLLLLLFLGIPAQYVVEANGAVSWFSIPVLGTIQPAEFMKVFLIITIAHLIVRHHAKFVQREIKHDLWLFTKIMLVAIPPMGLIAVQPDLGGLLVLIAITGSMILVSGIRWRILFGLTLLSVLFVGALIATYYLFPGPIATFLEESIFKHVSSRFIGWLNPEQNADSGYQLILAMMAIGSGQLFGKGITDMEVYVPERHTDMIFTAISEQFGFIGASVVVTLFFLLIYRLIHIALLSNDQYGSYLVTGIIGMFAYQIFQNIGMSIQLLPITGLPLPFLSYGGSSTLTYMLAIGIVLNVHSRTRQYMFE
ncbi:FtsW/RodA/SpoVE family cell cycle protein [Oceanobacillus halotolerans]|uniref:FtsW/RodA/SpoVE family cell cycle protein n=1 Tax=Oceanobacillus halotolerans TaxID=2663380 RepID=UPI0013DD7785|nr:FtsW/RodA/SpoVE family cell cycle protein [Oceanobacillus halotolerans]